MPDFSQPGPLTLSPEHLAMLATIPPYDGGRAYAARPDRVPTWRGEPLQESVELSNVPAVGERSAVELDGMADP